MTSLKDEAEKTSAQVRGVFAELRRDVQALSRDIPLAELNPRLAPPALPPWDGIWRRRRALWWTAGGAALGTPFAAFVLALLDPEMGSRVAFLGFAVCAVCVVLLGAFICPRCGRRFNTVRKSRFRRRSNGFTNRCLYCGLEAGASDGAWSGD